MTNGSGGKREQIKARKSAVVQELVSDRWLSRFNDYREPARFSGYRAFSDQETSIDAKPRLI